MRRTHFLIWFLLFTGFVTAQDQLKVAFYNLFEYPEYIPTNRAPFLKEILSEIDPDLFLVCELLTEEGADDILYHAMDYDSNRNFARAPFVPNQSSSSDMQQLLFYDQNIWKLHATEVLSTNYRDINKYKLQLRTEDRDNPVYAYAFITHLKSSPGLANRLIRLEMVETLTEHLAYLEPDAFVFFAGDFNLYSSDEEAYQELLSQQNAIPFIDPIDSPGDWHQNETFSYLHTQSTRVSNVGFGTGASGGMDDRFDFILLSENFFLDNPNLQYITDSYHAFGNNKNCYKKDIHDTDCTGEFSQEIREKLFWMSDHLPVVLEIETQRALLNTPTKKLPTHLPKIMSNPVENNLFIQIPSLTSDQPLKIKVYNVMGKAIINSAIAHKDSIISLPVEHLPAGVYFIQLSAFPQYTLKFIKK